MRSPLPNRREHEAVCSARRLVVIESPFSGDVEANTVYARECVRHSVLGGESPIASHLLLTQPGILDDNIFSERALGMGCGWAWIAVADCVAVYTDRGISEGMKQGIAKARATGTRVEYRSLETVGAIASLGAGEGL